MAGILKFWNKIYFGFCHEIIKQLECSLRSLQQDDMNELKQKELEIMQQESIWRQKSRNIWFKDGAKNTSYFHLSTIFRIKQKNDYFFAR